MTIYDFSLQTIKGEEQTLADYKGKVLVIVNTASKCGLTPQYEGLQKLYEQYHEQGLEILGFPSNQFAGQEPGSNAEVESFCQLNYGVTFPLFSKTDVNGPDAHPLFKHLIEAAPFQGADTAATGGEEPDNNDIKWNFTKFLIDRDGHVVKRFEPKVEPAAMAADIEKQL
ncbi:glutathione peroxidase [Paenibacillus beijingensis]|uniref:Glutathione peroxidase n=1 Tax=Paenibacillus beijingensis TaxID=1126833 RepID=A0A0D5NI87_9BACL|nr:glutathione peroxidase [Paenibacillus beijingensis]AJY74613.1 glutathione peroxidase [Paenibacillus beijingensis]